MTTQVQVQGLGQFASWDFTLEHVGDDELVLLHEGELVGRFSQTGASEKSLQKECALHLVKRHGWDGTLWSKK
ncbi:unnamed protein product [marine sediment metagenome]|uniref:Uncharacterized protein n=1 Tax=marine sediment metagenome TaxID=412755 RepID=X1RMD4_9ZZZZ